MAKICDRCKETSSYAVTLDNVVYDLCLACKDAIKTFITTGAGITVLPDSPEGKRMLADQVYKKSAKDIIVEIVGIVPPGDVDLFLKEALTKAITDFTIKTKVGP